MDEAVGIAGPRAYRAGVGTTPGSVFSSSNAERGAAGPGGLPVYYPIYPPAGGHPASPFRAALRSPNLRAEGLRRYKRDQSWDALPRAGPPAWLGGPHSRDPGPRGRPP